MKAHAGFSLLEVVFAVAVFAGGLVSVLTLMAPATTMETQARGAGVARELALSVQRELERLRDEAVVEGAGTSLQVVAAQVGDSGLRLVADAAGARLVREDEADAPDGIPAADRYHLIEIEQVGAPWGYRPDRGFLALQLVVSWPYHVPAGGAALAVPPEARSRFLTQFVLTP